MSYLTTHVESTRVTPQTSPIPGTVPNSAGGYSFAVDQWKQLDRFLILGSEGGSYYASERDLTRQNVDAVQKCLQDNAAKAIARIVEISDSGRAPKNDPALFALAMAAGSDKQETRALALAALPKVARIGTHLFHFVEYVQKFRGWGRGLRNAVGSWYTDRTDLSLATQIFKYQSRDGWSHGDVLTLAHPQPRNAVQSALFKYAVKGEMDIVGAEPAAVWAAQAYKLLHTNDSGEAVRLITDYKFPRELVPTKLLNSPEVWDALLPHMGLTALIRNLGKMTSVGLLTPLGDASKLITGKLGDAQALKESRVHPLQVLVAAKVYAQGHGDRGSLVWTPVNRVSDALDSAFYGAFGNITRTGKRFILGVDVSGSMAMGTVGGMSGITPRIGAAVMAMVTARTESEYQILGFHHGITDLNIRASDSLTDVVRKMSINNGGGTDAALPFTWAQSQNIPADMFVTYTDSETWAGKIHPMQALKKYRETTGIPARMAVVAMVSSGFSIADPMDAGAMDVVGFDTATPELLAQFALGNI